MRPVSPFVHAQNRAIFRNNNSNNRTDRSTSKDFSDVSRRVGLPPSTGRTFDIYVDPADDPDIGEIVVLKKKKSRAGLNEVQWNALGDVTNTGEAKSNNTKHSNPDAPLKPKREEEKGRRNARCTGRRPTVT